MATVLQLIEQRNSIWEQMKEIGNRAAEGPLSAEDQATWDKADVDVVELDKRIAMQKRLEEMPASGAASEGGPRAGGVAGESRAAEQRRAPDEYESVFARYIRYGQGGLSPEENISMMQNFRGFGAGVEHRDEVTNIATQGGYLVPEGFMRELEVATLAYGGMREVARILPTDGGEDLPWPTSNDTSNTGRILNETATASETDVTFGRMVLKAHMYSSDLVQVSFQLMQDSAFALEPFLAETLATRIARITNTHFTTGTGANEPMGVVTAAVSQATAAGTTAVTFDELLALEHGIDPSYRKGASWMFRDATLRALKLVKDGEGRYLWWPGGPSNGGGQPTLWNYPYTINQDVPAMATGNKAILFGDFKKYIIRDVRGFQLMRLNERSAVNGLVDFLGFSRHDGGLLDAGRNPIQCITMA